MTEIAMNALDRRAFLSSSGALVVTLAASADLAAPQPQRRARSRNRPLQPDQLSSYITIEADGTVLAYYGKIDGGQGLGTSIAQMVAEEIDVPFERCASSWATAASPSTWAGRARPSGSPTAAWCCVGPRR